MLHLIVEGITRKVPGQRQAQLSVCCDKNEWLCYILFYACTSSTYFWKHWILFRNYKKKINVIDFFIFQKQQLPLGLEIGFLTYSNILKRFKLCCHIYGEISRCCNFNLLIIFNLTNFSSFLLCSDL